MSEAAKKRESKRQQFIETTLTHMVALDAELLRDPRFLSPEQLQRLRVAVSDLNSSLSLAGAEGA